MDGSDFDGAFAQYVVVPVSEVFTVDCDWSDVELATIPCAYGTAENMVHRASVTNADTVLVTGASGGVGSAVVQLTKRRGAKVIALSSASKFDHLRQLGADQILDRGIDLTQLLGDRSVDTPLLGRSQAGDTGYAPFLFEGFESYRLHRLGRARVP